MPRTRPAARFSSEAPSESSTSTSPERAADDDTDFFMAQANDSQSSVGVVTFRDLNVGNGQSAFVPPIGRLPPEILISIFSKLNSPSDMLNCMLVCQKWAANCVGILWHRPSCNRFENLKSVVDSVGKRDGLFPYSELVKRLNLSALTDKVSDGTVVPFTQCKRIERLTLTNCSKLTDKGVSDLLEGNRHLQAIDVSELRSLTDHTLFSVARNCPRLQGLNITGCMKVTDDSLVTVSENCRQLKRLKLNSVIQVTDKSILSFAQNCPSILEIDLHDCKLVTSASVTSLLSTLRNLRELRLAHCVEIDDSAFLSLPQHLVFDSLRILDLTACENVKDDAAERIINASPRLRNLVLAKCKFITDNTVSAICKLGKNLHYVHLGHCSNITDSAVIQLAKSCNRIRYIDLACCNHLTDISVQQLANLPKLRRIGLVKCQSITDRSILALARSRSHSPGISSLERVHLSYCINLTMEGIHALLNHCPRLTHLSLTGVTAFLREDLTAFCRDAPPEFTPQQRDVFCVFSGDGVGQLRDFLNRSALPFHEETEATMYDDDEELDEDEGHVTGLMNATAINDDDEDGAGDRIIGVGLRITRTPPMASREGRGCNPLAFNRWPVTIIATILYISLLTPLIVIQHVLPAAPPTSPRGLDLDEAWRDLQYLTSGFHPFNSHRNDHVREWLLERVHRIIEGNAPENKPGVLDEYRPEVFVFDDMQSNITFYSGTVRVSSGLSVYFEGTNIIVYIRGSEDDTENWWEVPDGEPSGKGGVLVNAHYDSVSTGYGATDDGIGVVTCLQLIKYFTAGGHSPRRGLVVLLNNGEEDSLNGAYAYSQHPISKFPHTFLNLEGAGAGGPATLFRSSDLEVTRFYQNAPYPLGSVLADNGFKLGLIRSQTDFVVFEGKLGLRGLDVAFIKPRARYHTDQDDVRHASRESMWHMLSAAVATTEGLVSDTSDSFDGEPQDDGKVPSGRGTSSVWFDLFGRSFVVFRLHTLFGLSVALLVVGPLFLFIISVILSKLDKMYPFSISTSLEADEKVQLRGLRGLFRFPFLFGVPTAVTIGLAYLVTKINPLIAHSSEYAVWSMMASVWIFLAWFLSRVADFARPTALHRLYSLTWMSVLMWVLLVIATVYENRDGLAGGYFIFFCAFGTFIATWISYLELFCLPPKAEHASQFRHGSRRPSSFGSRLLTPSADEIGSSAQSDEEPTESAPLLRSGQRTTFANYTMAEEETTLADEGYARDEEPGPNVHRHEQTWSSKMPKWTWVLQFIFIAPVVIIFVGHLAFLITAGLHQTGQDGSPVLVVYLFIVISTALLFTPLLPFIHRFTYHLPTFMLLIFIGTLIYNLVAFPFSSSNRLKLFFLQEVDLDTGVNRVSLTGVTPFVNDAIKELPTAYGKDVTCELVVDRVKCSWDGLFPHVVATSSRSEAPAVKDWVSFNVSRVEGKSRARFEISGVNTRACRLSFDSPVSNFKVAGSAVDKRFPNTSREGLKEIRLWSRTWENRWTVDVEWWKGNLSGRAICLWNDENTPGVIPALDEIRQYSPEWVAVTKLSDGLVEGSRSFKI
ncbi:hypothetical protein V8E54_004910 [Elaphomyces granulatus]